MEEEKSKSTEGGPGDKPVPIPGKTIVLTPGNFNQPATVSESHIWREPGAHSHKTSLYMAIQMEIEPQVESQRSSLDA
jgi:hypothetical protein